MNYGEPEQGALYQIEGPDEDGCVWACSPAGRDVWCQNLGPTQKVAEVLSQWLGSIDYDEVETASVDAAAKSAFHPKRTFACKLTIDYEPLYLTSTRL